jgi:hypothetical protein
MAGDAKLRARHQVVHQHVRQPAHHRGGTRAAAIIEGNHSMGKTPIQSPSPGQP